MSENLILKKWTPRALPDRQILEGRYARLEPLDPMHHGEALYDSALAAGYEGRFRYLFEDAPPNREAFQAWLENASASKDPLFFAVVDKQTNRAEGRQALMRITPDHGVIEIGNILWGPAIARTRIATEAFYLFARYVFDTLGYRRFEWKCNALNAPSRGAAHRFGFAFEGVFRQHMVVKNQNRDTAWFSIIDGEWPRLRQGYEAWLDPENFTPDGTQKAKLAAQD